MKLTLITAAAVIALRLGLTLAGRAPEGTDFMLVHFLALVTIVFFTGRAMLAEEVRTPFPDLLRDGFRNAALYALLMGLYLWIHYTRIEPGFFPDRIGSLVAKGVAEGQPETVIRPRIERFFTPFNYATITFFALLFAGAMNAFVIGLLHHKVLRRFS
ncbi:MAG: hypothetical protein JNM31_00170 [Flavobacteriales bacterium]|nr:hypothetical protein [Flavobacteriales bacterium]